MEGAVAVRGTEALGCVGSHWLNSFIQFCRVLTGTTHRTCLAGVYLMNMSMKEITYEYNYSYNKPGTAFFGGRGSNATLL